MVFLRGLLFELRDPSLLLGQVAGLLVGVVLHYVVQAVVAGALGDRRPRLAGRSRLGPRRHFEPFGVVAMLIAGIGWGQPVPLEGRRLRGRARYVLAILSGVLVNVTLATAGLLALRAVPAGHWGRAAVGGFVVTNACLAVLQLIPLPPLDGYRVLFAFTPRTGGWQKAAYYLEEQNWGLGILLLLLLLLFGGVGLLMRIVLAVTEAWLVPLTNSLVG